MTTYACARCIQRLTLVGALLSTAAAAGEEDGGPRFVPPADLRPFSRVVGTPRGGADAAIVTVLTGDGAHRTARERPVIYWYISRATDRPVVVALNLPGKRTLAEVEVKPPIKQGDHRFDFATAAPADGGPVKLEPGVVYEVTVRVLLEGAGRSRQPLARAGIQRVPKEDVPPRLGKTDDPVTRAELCGKAGLWFDYFDELNAAIAKYPDPSNRKFVNLRGQALAARGLEFEPDGSIRIKRPETPAEAPDARRR